MHAMILNSKGRIEQKTRYFFLGWMFCMGMVNLFGTLLFLAQHFAVSISRHLYGCVAKILVALLLDIDNIRARDTRRSRVVQSRARERNGQTLPVTMLMSSSWLRWLDEPSDRLELAELNGCSDGHGDGGPPMRASCVPQPMPERRRGL